MPFPTIELLILEKKACMTVPMGVEKVTHRVVTVTLAGMLGWIKFHELPLINAVLSVSSRTLALSSFTCSYVDRMGYSPPPTRFSNRIASQNMLRAYSVLKERHDNSFFRCGSHPISNAARRTTTSQCHQATFTFRVAETGYLGLAQFPLASSFLSQLYELGLLLFLATTVA